MVKKCFTEFRCGHKNQTDVELSAVSVEVTTSQTIQKNRDNVMADRILKVREIVEATTNHNFD